VVDDEPLVATSLARVLSRWHRVEVATSGRDAIARVAAGRRYDHILCDLAMPDAGGMDVHGELARIAPEQARRIVLMTGGAFTERTRSFLESWSGPWIEKPIDFDELRRILDEPRGS
jgi:CheY-like chemotaxis protein